VNRVRVEMKELENRKDLEISDLKERIQANEIHINELNVSIRNLFNEIEEKNFKLEQQKTEHEKSMAMLRAEMKFRIGQEIERYATLKNELDELQEKYQKECALNAKLNMIRLKCEELESHVIDLKKDILAHLDTIDMLKKEINKKDFYIQVRKRDEEKEGCVF
jgi:small-conductance mechanosensitive channel